MSSLILCKECEKSNFIIISQDTYINQEDIKALPCLVLFCVNCGKEQSNIEALLVSPGEILENFDSFYNIYYKGE